MNAEKPIIITAGEPSGIGPDIVLDIAQYQWKSPLAVIADPALLKQRAKKLRLETQIVTIDHAQQSAEYQTKNILCVLPVQLNSDVECGKLNPNNSKYVIDCLSLAETLCRENTCAGVVTGPVHKGIINQSGLPFTGHTEFFAAPSNSKPVMMLATKTLRVALATTHLPLRNVSDAITEELLISVITTLNQFLINHCQITAPSICICGLNPHAGEDGHLGDEELTVINPAIEKCAKMGIQLSNALPADTAFTNNNLKHFDAVLAMYHDQGLPVLKHLGFGEAVNITLGLPFIRTSVDHGTALTLAGTGQAKSSSLISAINMAIDLTQPH